MEREAGKNFNAGRLCAANNLILVNSIRKYSKVVKFLWHVKAKFTNYLSTLECKFKTIFDEEWRRISNRKWKEISGTRKRIKTTNKIIDAILGRREYAINLLGWRKLRTLDTTEPYEREDERSRNSEGGWRTDGIPVVSRSLNSNLFRGWLLRGSERESDGLLLTF